MTPKPRAPTVKTLAAAKPGAWLELGRYGERKPALPVRWRVTGAVGPAVTVIAEGVITKAAFDQAGGAHPHGDNRWRDASLRSWLDGRFLAGFDDDEKAALVRIARATEVTSGYSANRAASVDQTQDRVWVPTWEEYKKLPKALRGGTRTAVFLRDHPDELIENQLHWSRSPLADLGVALFEHWERERRHTNSGASQVFAIRPCLALRGDLEVTGKGTEADPFSLA